MFDSALMKNEQRTDAEHPTVVAFWKAQTLICDISLEKVPPPMESPRPTKRDEILESLNELLITKSSQLDGAAQLCSRCGAPMQSVDASLSLYETDLVWNIRLPICECEAAANTDEPSALTAEQENTMASAGADSSPAAGWKELYRLALFEADKARVVVRIAAAKESIAAREQALFYAGSAAMEERKALEAALYGLQLLLTCGSLTRKDTQSTARNTRHGAA